MFTFLLPKFKDDDEIHANVEPPRVRQARAVMKEYPPDTPDLDRKEVNLDIPIALFGQLSLDVAIRTSEILGVLIQVSIIFLIP